jgi:hypothetical protein
MRLLDRPVRPKPSHFGPDGAPPGIALRLDAYATLDDGLPWTSTRPTIKPNTIVGHTNGASVEATVQSSLNFGRNTRTKDGRNTTKPHYLLGDKPAKVLRSDLRGIANSTSSAIEVEYGVQDSSYWALAVETADIGSIAAKARGINWPYDCGPFLYDNADDLAHIIAYEAIVHGFPIRVPPTFPAGGVVAHTWPWPYPYFTTKPGKTCPGTTKIAAIRDEIIPRAQQIRAVWTQPTPEPDHPEEADMAQISGIRLRINDRDGNRYHDQVVALTIGNPEQLHKIGAADDRLIEANLNATRAEIEAELGFKLSPM